MKLTLPRLALTVLATVITAAAQQPVKVNADSSLEGIGRANNNPLASGFYEVGWLNPGVTEAQIDGFFALGNLAAIDTAFNTVAAFSFDTATNSFGTGMVFASINVVAAGDAPSLLTYQTNVAGKRAYIWVRDNANIGSTIEMAFVDTVQNFNTAVDSLGFTDYNTNVGTDNASISAANVWVGTLAPVLFGSGIDINDGSPANSMGLYDENTFLQTATVVPEPSTALALLGGIGLLGLRRRRA